MRAHAATLLRNTTSVLLALALACGLVPVLDAPAAVAGEGRTLASGLAGEPSGAAEPEATEGEHAAPVPVVPAVVAASGSLARISADAPLGSSAQGAVHDATVEEAGFLFAPASDGQGGLSAVLVGTSSAMGEASVPSEVAFGATACPVSRIAPGAVEGSSLSSLSIPATVSSVDDGALSGAPFLESIQVEEGNPAYSSYDGMLFDADMTRLLLVPEGKQGAARIPSTAEVVPPSAFSHCAGVTAISVEAGSAAYLSRNGCLYDASGEALLRVPAGLADVAEAAPGCSAVAAGALEGCSMLLGISGLGPSLEVADDGSGADARATRELLARLALDGEGAAQEPAVAAASPLAPALASGASRALALARQGASPEEGGPSAPPAAPVGAAPPATREGAAPAAADVPSGSCLVSFDGNGGEGGQAGASAVASLGQALPAIAGEAPVRPGFAFMGWRDGSGWQGARAYYDPDGSPALAAFPFEGRALTLYAAWDPVVSVAVPLSVGLRVGTAGEVEQAGSPRLASSSAVEVAPVTLACSDEGLASAFDRPELVALTVAGPEGEPVAVRVGSELSDAGALSALAVPAGGELPVSHGADLNGATVLVGDGAGASGTARLSYGMAASPGWDGPSRATVAFDANGGEGGPAGSLEAVEGQPMPALGASAPARFGYAFQGWFDGPEWEGAAMWYAPDGSSARDWEGGPARVLYAGWASKEGQQVRLAWDACGGEPASRETAQAFSASATVDPPSDPARPGYAFAGWWTSPSGGERVTSATRLPDADAAFYAHWEGAVIRLAWDANGGSAVAPTEQAYSEGATVALPEPPTREGYAFQGWFDAASGGSEVTSSTPLPTSGATFYARWAGRAYQVSFDANGGTGGQSEAVTATYGSPMPKISPTPPSRTGHAFGGWWDTSAASGGKRYYAADGASARDFDRTSATTLYARWSLNSYAVTFDRQGGTGGTASKTVPHGSTVGAVDRPTLSGWAFSGYTDDFSASPYLYAKADGTATTRTITGSKTLHANWTKTVSLSANGGTAGSFALLTAGIGRPLGQKCTQVASSNVDYPIRSLFSKGIADDAAWKPTRTGYAFAGYYDTSASTGGTQWVSASGVGSTVTSAVPSTLYARWDPVPYTITWSPNGGSWSGSTASKTTTVRHGTATTAPSPAPTRTGYALKGWSTSSTATTPSALPTSTTAARTYYAVWALNEYSVTWNPNGGNWSGSTASKATKAKHGSTIAKYATDPTRAGWLFKGWATSSTATTPLSSLGTATGAKTFYAVWGKPTPTGSTSDALYINNTNAEWGAVGVYGLADIKAAANDLAKHANDPTQSGYYELYHNFLTGKGRFVVSRFLSGNSHAAFLIGLCQDTKTDGTKAGLTFSMLRFAHSSDPFAMSVGSSDTSGWNTSWMKKHIIASMTSESGYLLNELLTPETGIEPVRKTHQKYANTDTTSSYLQYSDNETFWIPSVYELTGKAINGINEAEQYTKGNVIPFQYEYYKIYGYKIMPGDSTGRYYWTRTNVRAAYGGKATYAAVNPYSEPSPHPANSELDYNPCFCL